MSNAITGKIIAKGEVRKGEGNRGPWRVQTYVLETSGDYPKSVAFQVWNDKIDEFGIRKDDEVEITFDPESREYNGKWYTDLRTWKCTGGSGGKVPEPATPPPPQASDFDDDVPF